MTLTELWELFPIVLVPYKPEWKIQAEAEIASLAKLLSSIKPVISHIGSTAVPGIMAKPTIDILVEMPADTDWRSVRARMEAAGYICMSVSDGRMSFNKGYTPDGYAEKVYHIHFHPMGDNDEIFFRDYLISHPDAAREYERLKTGLLPRYRNDRDGYTRAKTEFVRKITAYARKQSTAL